MRKLLLILALLLGLPAAARADYPGAGIFGYTCGSNTITFSYQNKPALQASFSQIAGPLAAAISTQQNQPVVVGNTVGLWALKSNELQVHLNADPDGTKLVLPSDICGAIGGGTPSAVAYAQVSGAGTAVAIAQVTESGQSMAFAGAAGSGQALAYAQATGGGYGPSPAAGARYHVVQPGENLFRISLRYGTTVAMLAAINHISDTRLIYVGQVIYLP
jgi:LysM repeat protein